MDLQASFPSSSSSSSFSYAWSYDVFISFRGCDTRHGFTRNLYEALIDKGIHTFFDDQELQGGEKITPSLVKAIQESRIAIVVFSMNYASSSFCLDELAMIMKFVEGKGRLVLPVFYDVDPCDVRHQRGSYGEAMAKHEERFKDDKKKVQKWREALHQAANLSGQVFKLGNEYEYVFIQKIVKEMSDKINRVPLYIADYPVGLESQVLKVNWLLNDGFDGRVIMVGICGIGGIGKTTLARAVYNFIADQFEALCFLEKVREKSIKLGLVHLQETLLSEILGDKNIRIGSVYQGIPIIKQRLHRKKILLVLDDIDKLEQLRAIVGGTDWFGSGSKVIITTRDNHLLASHGIERKYKVEGLSEKEALDLLSWNAFKSKDIDPSYMDILKDAITYACGLPLALEVIGSNLFGKSIEEWRSELNQYERIPNKEIQEILKISFDALDECQQKIFLDIACCFNDNKWVEVKDMLHARHDVSFKYGISVLVQKSLLKIDTFGYVTLHDLIQDMGREIIRLESPKHPGRRSRLWLPKDVVQVLEEDRGTSEIEIMILDAPKFEKIVVEWDGETFKQMRNLEILIIKNTHFSQGAKHLPNSLRVLEWWNYPSNLLPSDFHPKGLVIFKLTCSSLISVGFLEKRKFKNLTVLNLDKSYIEQIPDVSGAPNLGKLSFRDCENLIKVHESVGFLDKLCCLGVSGCSKLRSFPALKLPCLAELDFSGCSSLENFPKILGDMEGLAFIYLYGTSIKELPSSITNLRNLESLKIGDVDGLLRLSGSTSMLQRLKTHGCGELQFRKQDKGQGSSMVSSNTVTVSFKHVLDEFVVMVLALFRDNVVSLDLSGNTFTFLPEIIRTLGSLRKLTLDNCKELGEIRGISPNIESWSAANCISLSPSSRSMLLSQELHSSGCKMFHLPGSSVPKWFKHDNMPNSFAFWWSRGKLPSISLCVVTEPVSCIHVPYIVIKLIINGKEREMNSFYYYSVKYTGIGYVEFKITREADHITIFDQEELLLEHEDEQLSKNERNHVEYRVKAYYEGDYLLPSIKKIGFHVHGYESNREDIRFTDPLWQKEEVNMGDFHLNMEQLKNLASLALLEMQQAKWSLVHLPPTMNSLNDNVNGDLNSITLMQTSSSTSVQVHNGSARIPIGSDDDPCWEETFHYANLESYLFQLPSSSSDTLKDQDCGEPSRKRKRSSLMLDLNNEPDSDSVMSSSDKGGSDGDSWKRDKKLLSLHPCWEEPLDRENLKPNLMQLASTSDTLRDQGCGELSRKRKRSTLMLDLNNNESNSEVDLDLD